MPVPQRARRRHRDRPRRRAAPARRRRPCPRRSPGVKNLAHIQITHRVQTLTAAVNKAKKAKGLGAGRGPLESYLGQDIGPLQQLDTKIQNDGTLQQATADYGTIFSSFRVYRLVLPAAHVAAGASRVTNTAVPGFQAVVTRAERHSSSTNQSTLNPLVDNLKSQIATASNATNGLAGSVLADTPAQWNANNSLLSPAQASIEQAVGAVKQGRKDVRQLRQVLVPGGVHHKRTGHHKKHGAGHPTSTTSTTTTSTTS